MYVCRNNTTMINANELRIGNLLNYQTAEGDILTATIDWQALKWISEDSKGFNLVHSAIPLTEDWLLKFGFEKIVGWDDITFFSKNGVDIEIHNDGFYANRKIEYIHTLQNLYFALTGVELEMKGGCNE